MKLYNLYYSEKESSYTFIEALDNNNLNSLAKDSKLIFQIEAKSWEVACLKKNKFLGFEPFKPLILKDEDLFQFLPENKFDFDNLELLFNIGYPKIKPILPNLFEWIQDMNWPIAPKIAQFLSNLGVECKKEILKILSTGDSMTKYWLLSSVLYNMDLKSLQEFKLELTELYETLNKQELEDGIDKVILEILEKVNSYS